MKLSSRLSEYGIVGAFFLISQIVASVLIFTDATQENAIYILKQLKDMGDAAGAFATPLASLLAVLALILVFFVGLVIDLVGFYVLSVEIPQFRRELYTHKAWLDPIVERHSFLIKNAWKRIVDEYTPHPTITGGFRKEFFSTLFSWKYLKQKLKNLRYLYLTRSYHRLFNFMIILSLQNTNEAHAQVIQDQMSLWRTSRSIALVLIILMIELALHFVVNLLCGENSFFQLTFIFPMSIILSLLAVGLGIRSFEQLSQSVLGILSASQHEKNAEEQ